MALVKRLGKRFTLKILELIQTFIVLKFGIIHQSVLGHLVFDTEVNVLESLRRRGREYWYLFGSPANTTISEFWRKELNANSNVLRLKLYSAIDNSKTFDHMLLSRPIGAGDGNILDDYPPTFRFTTTQRAKATRILNQLPFDPGSPLVLFCLRDDAYYRQKADFGNLATHSHRNVDVQEYKSAIDFLISKGYSVVRMGRVAESPLPIENSKFIDLPFSRTFGVDTLGVIDRELLELALFEKCDFVVSTGLGTDSLATLFRKRVYYSDYYSVYHLYSSKLFPTFLPKGYENINTGKLFSAEEVFSGGFLKCQTASEFAASGVRLLNCTSQSIYEFISDVYNLENGAKVMECTKLSHSHIEVLSKGVFAGKHIPQISERWANQLGSP